MAPQSKLTYFNITGLGEPIRFLLSYGKGDFEDNRVEYENWPSIKGYTPFGQMPVLEIEGKKLYQTLPICRYLGIKYGLAGNNEEENLQIDIAAECVNDIRMRIGEYYYESDVTQKEKKKGPLFKEYLPFIMPKLENIVKENGGYCAAGRLTWADLYFAAISDYMNRMAGIDVLKDYPNLVALKKKVTDIPAIKQYISKRPNTRV